MSLNLFPIFNPITNQFIDYKDRYHVHRDGDWHVGIQANIIIKKLNTFDILIQERSSEVDIGLNKFDQSLATQMSLLDNLSPELTLKRGLMLELGITKYEYRKIPNRLFIIKKYNSQREMFNREILHMFIVKIEDISQINISTTKIKSLYRMEWKYFLDFFNENKNKFTKTSQFYFSNKKILKNIKKIQEDLANSSVPRVLDDSYGIIHINKSNREKKSYLFNKDKLSDLSYLFE